MSEEGVGVSYDIMPETTLIYTDSLINIFLSFFFINSALFFHLLM